MKILRTKFLWRLSCAVLLIMAMVLPAKASNTEGESDLVVYDSTIDIKAQRTTMEAPTKEGYVFAGWYKEDSQAESGYVALSADEADAANSAVAKFVDKRVLAIKLQTTEGTCGQSESTIMRILTSVDSLQYMNVGFDITLKGSTTTRTSKTVYETIKAYTKDGVNNYTAAEAFECDASKYFVAFNISEIMNAYFSEIFTITPIWTTVDGTRVSGTPRDFKVKDGYLYSIHLDGATEEWTEAQKDNVLKGWYQDEDDNTRGLEYMAFADDKYVYLYTKSITASNAEKSHDIRYHNALGTVIDGVYQVPAVSESQIVDKYVNFNEPLENGLYESVAEYVIDKTSIANSKGDIYIGVWFLGCDDSFEPLSWHEAGKTTNWGLNHMNPGIEGFGYLKVTQNGYDHYHALDANNVCGWCQETVELPITVDGDASDWDQAILQTAVSNKNSNLGMTFVAFRDDKYSYVYAEVTDILANPSRVPNVFCINGTRKDEVRFGGGIKAYFDLGTLEIRPWCQRSTWNCGEHYTDCSNAFVKIAYTAKTNDAGQAVYCYEAVLGNYYVTDNSGTIKCNAYGTDTNGLILVQIPDRKITPNGLAQ